MNDIIRIENLRRDFKVGDQTVHALRGISFTIHEGEFVTIMGDERFGQVDIVEYPRLPGYPHVG